jgi:hypothetical protein
MKKVRYLIGAAGALAMTPAVGALTPAAQAATTQTAHTAYTAHTAAISSSNTTSAGRSSTSPAVSLCGAFSNSSAHTGTGANQFQAWAFFSNPTGQCVYATKGRVYHSQTGLEMRTRLYRNGKRVFQGYAHGFAIPIHTTFSERPIRVIAQQACEALVYSTNRAKVAYGPVCVHIPS